MVDVVEKIVARGPLGFTQLRYVVYEATVSTNDTITLGELSLGLIYNVSFSQATGLSITTSVSGTEITITEGSLTNLPIVGLAIVGDVAQAYFPYTFPYVLS